MQPTSFLKVYDAPSDSARSRAEKYGYAVTLMCASKSHSALPLSYVRAVVQPAVRLGNIKFYFNEEGSIVGYVIWALLATDVEERLMTGTLALHLSEWNEGTNLWIVDLLVPAGSFKYVLEDMKGTLFSSHRSAKYRRIVRGRAISRTIFRRSDRLTLECHKVAE